MEEGRNRGRREWEERGHDVLAKSCCTHDRKPAHAVKWCARRHGGTATTVARIFISSLPHHPSSPLLLSSPFVTYAPRGLGSTVLETVQIKQVKTREKDEGGREKKRDEEMERERKRRSDDEGKWWGAARAIRPLHHLLHRCIEDVAPGLRRDTICLLYTGPILQETMALLLF